MEWKDYADYGPEDFLADDYFAEWVLRPGRENEAFWTQWQQQYPERKPMVEEARRILLSLEYARDEMPVESYDRIWSVLSDEMMQPAAADRSGRKWPYVLAAAVITGVLALAAVWFFRKEAPPLTYASEYGEKRTLVLPDSSEVVLAPHSSLRVGRFGEKREVWLEGEAYFSIRHQPGKAVPFTVHSRSLDIDVLGTSFNVNNYNGNTQVVLHSGKVALRQGEKVVVMRPGELVEFEAEAQEYRQREVKPEPYTSWVKGIMSFEDTRLDTVAQRLFYQYGVNIVFEDAGLAGERFSATLPEANLQVVITALKEAFGLQVRKEDNNTFVFSRITAE